MLKHFFKILSIVVMSCKSVSILKCFILIYIGISATRALPLEIVKDYGPSTTLQLLHVVGFLKKSELKKKSECENRI